MVMRKLFVVMGLLLCCMVVKAQDDDLKKNQWAVEAGVGGTGVTTIDLGVRWQMNFYPNVAWDVLTVKALAAPDSFSETIMPQVMTGLHLTSPKFVGMSAYFIGRAGYGYWIDKEAGGFCFEVGGGINVTKHIYVGYAYNHQKGTYDYTYFKKGSGGKYSGTLHTAEEDYKSDYHAFRIGFYF